MSNECSVQLAEVTGGTLQDTSYFPRTVCSEGHVTTETGYSNSGKTVIKNVSPRQQLIKLGDSHDDCVYSWVM